MTLEVENLAGGYSGINVIENVNLTIELGQAIGLIRLSGAGKSTTTKHLLGLLRMQKDKITLNGTNLTEDPAESKKMVAYIPKTPVLYPELTLKEHSELVILIYGLGRDQAWVRAKELCKVFRLENKLDWSPIKFSKGMKQGAMIMANFLANADLLVIDEPFTGLDPLAVANFIDLVKRAVTDQEMVLMTTRILAETQGAVQTFAVLNNSTIETASSLTGIRQFYGLKLSDSFGRLYQILSQRTMKKHD